MEDALTELPPHWCRIPLSSDTVFCLERVRIFHFRSIGAEGCEIDLTKPVSLLIGPNNSGKSNALRALDTVFSMKAGWLNNAWPDVDRHLRGDVQPTLALSGMLYDNYGRATYGRTEWRSSSVDVEQHIATTATQPDKCRVRASEIWALGKVTKGGVGKVANEWMDCTDVGRAFLTHVLAALPFDRPHTVGPIRYGMPCTGDRAALQNLVRDIAAWERPAIGRDNERERWITITQLLADIVGEQLSLEPMLDNDNATVIVKTLVEGQPLRLPLDHFGTGFQEVLAIARELAVSEPTLFLMEEPEVHLHPRLQRRLLDSLISYGQRCGHRFVISTHSPFLMSRANGDCGIVRVWRESSLAASKARPVTISAEAMQALSDLGVAASDVLQARYVIWVEGPSDAIYLGKWMELYCSKHARRLPVRGVDYCFAWYGGALAAHIGIGGEVAPNAEINDGDDSPDGISRLVELLHLSQYGALVLDSDQASSSAPRKGRTERLVAECEQSSNRYIAWVTAGREIENYLDAETVARAFNSRAARASSRVAEAKLRIAKWNRLDESLAKAIGASGSKRPYSGAGGKVAAARTIVEHMDTFLDKHDLGEQIGRLLDAIESRSDVIGTGR
jgi:ABC-type arginine transport system ATPase subunit